MELSKDNQYDKEVVNIIENDIISGIVSYYNKNNYLLFDIQVVSVYKDRISQSNLDKYSSALMKVISTDTDNVLNAYRVVNKLNSTTFWCNNTDIILKYVSKGTYAVIYDIVTGRLELFNAENSNLTQLIHMLMNIKYDEDNASIKLAKFIDNCEVNVIIKIVSDEWGMDDVHKEKLVRVLSKSEKYSIHEIIHRIDENKENINKNDLLSMLEFCGGDVTENNVESFINIVKYLLANYLEKDVCAQILMRISNLPQNVIAKQRESICMILVEIFRKSSSEENRKRSSVIIKDKGLGRKMKGKLDESELKEYRSYLS